MYIAITLVLIVTAVNVGTMAGAISPIICFAVDLAAVLIAYTALVTAVTNKYINKL